jgi:hypothetical protein
MKKLLTALLATVMMVSSFTFVALAADPAVTVAYENGTSNVVVSVTGFEANQRLSFVTYYGDEVLVQPELNEENEDDVDYLNQFDFVADENGAFVMRYLSNEAFDESLAEDLGDHITVFVNSVRGFDVIAAEAVEDPEVYITGKTLYTVKPGTEITLAVEVIGDAEIAWSSNKEDVATVVDGVVTAKAIGKGTATITASLVDADGEFILDAEGNAIQASVLINVRP